MKKVEVFDGGELKPIYHNNKNINARYSFWGTDAQGREISIPFDEETLSRHLLLIGGIGTGKTNAFYQILSQLRNSLTRNDVMIIFDTKGDFYNAFYRKGDVVISNDEKATGVNGIDFWNIFNEIELNDHMEENIVEISKSLFYEKTSKTSQPFFPNAAKDLFSAILLHFCRNKETMHIDNKRLREFLDSSPTAELRNILQQHQDLKAMISYISDDRSPQTQGVMSELQQLSREILLGNFKKSGNLSIRQLVRHKGGKIIFIEYDLGIGNMLTPIYRLLLDMAIKEALSRSKSEGNVWIVADEFKLIPNLQHVDDAVNFGRSLGVKFMIGIQNVDQVYNAYGKELAKSILSGFLTSVSFRVNDSESKDFIKSLYGANRKKEIYMSAVGGRGVVEQIRDAHVVEDWDISTLEIGEAIIGLPGKEPFKFKFKKYS
jgi:type IV secretory pathway TraG/TraD family ATPase VirD4